jgi:hypothetical protein
MFKSRACAILNLTFVLFTGASSVDALAQPHEQSSKSAGLRSAVPSDIRSIEWQRFREELQGKSNSPEERIAAVDAWIAANPESIRAPKPALAVAKPDQREIVTRRSFVASSGDPKQAALESAIASEFEPILAAKLSPEERIRQIDEALLRTKESRKALDQARQEEALQKSMDRAPIERDAVGMRPTFPDTPVGRLESELSNRSADLRARTKDLSPEQRISVIDAALPEIQKIERDIQKLRSKPTSSPARLSTESENSPIP